MDDLERHGCIHTTYHYGNSSDREEIAICSCCKDCCILYGSSRDGSISQVFVKSFYSPEMIDEDRCVGCNACGQCVVQCKPEDAKDIWFAWRTGPGCRKSNVLDQTVSISEEEWEALPHLSPGGDYDVKREVTDKLKENR